jgi:hypothetical protein
LRLYVVGENPNLSEVVATTTKAANCNTFKRRFVPADHNRIHLQLLPRTRTPVRHLQSPLARDEVGEKVGQHAEQR